MNKKTDIFTRNGHPTITARQLLSLPIHLRKEAALQIRIIFRVYGISIQAKIAIDNMISGFWYAYYAMKFGA